MVRALLAASVCGVAAAAGAQVVGPVAPVSGGSVPSVAAGPQTNTAGQVQGARPSPAAGRDQTQERQDEQRRNSEEELRTIAPDAPTEFQRLVQETTGAALPIFGSDLFFAPPSTFAPVDDVPVGADYLIGPGDEIRIQTFGQVNQEGLYTVDRTGAISYPDVGNIHVAGVPYGQLAAFLRSQLGRVYRNFELNANLGQLRSMQVFVVGEARRPGAYTVSSLSTLLNALFESGGPLPQGSLRNIEVLRRGDVVTHFDLYDLLLHGDKTHDIKLEPGDVIYIPVVGPQVAIAGSVNTPAIYEFLPGTTVSDTLALAGGPTSVALGAKVRLDRIFEHTMRSIVDVNLADGQNPIVANGDILTVSAILDRYLDAVTLRGNVAFPGRYVWKPGMRILDIVANKEQLITREYYRRRNALGNPSTVNGAPAGAATLNIRGPGGTVQATGPDTPVGAAVTPGTSTAASTAGGSALGAALTAQNNNFPAANDVVLTAPDIDWSYAVIERLEKDSLKTVLIPFDPGALYLRGDLSQNLLLQSGDVITFFSTADLRVPSSQQTRFVKLEGEFIASGVYSVEPGETLRHLLQRAGGLTPDAYLYGSEFTRESTRRVQEQRLNEYADNLEAQISTFSANANSQAISPQDQSAATAATNDARAAVARIRRLVPDGRIVLALQPDSRGLDAVPDLPLEDGDRFVVPRVPSTVSVEGQVYSANAFVFERSRKARDYLKKAGGPDREADRKRTFILRADGSVYSQQYGDVERALIFPGDTIVVPPQINKRAFLRDFLDYSTVVGQFGFAAAALDVLR